MRTMCGDKGCRAKVSSSKWKVMSGKLSMVYSCHASLEQVIIVKERWEPTLYYFHHLQYFGTPALPPSPPLPPRLLRSLPVSQHSSVLHRTRKVDTCTCRSSSGGMYASAMCIPRTAGMGRQVVVSRGGMEVRGKDQLRKVARCRGLYTPRALSASR